VRFLFELIKGYKVYYLSIDKNIIGYCVISRGGGRYSFAKKEDIVVGPYFVIEKYRGNKYSEILVNELLRYNGIKYCAAYDWVRQTNIPSIKCAQRCGFEVECTADIVKPFRTFRLRKDDLGEYFIFRKTNKVL
jgi:L-amino acid N-acyltransferase YncA